MMTFQGSTRTLRRPLKMSWPALIEGLRPFMKTKYFCQQKSLTIPICQTIRRLSQAMGWKKSEFLDNTFPMF